MTKTFLKTNPRFKTLLSLLNLYQMLYNDPWRVSRWRKSAMNFNIDDRLIQNYNNLPRDFRLADVMRFCSFKPEEKKLVSQQIVRLWKLGLIHRSAEGRFWSKRYIRIESWFKAFVYGKTPCQKQKATQEPEMTEIKSDATELPFPEL